MRHFYEHFYYCTLYLEAYTLDFLENAALWNEWKCEFASLEIKIENTFGPSRTFGLSHNVSQARDIKLSIAILLICKF